MASASDFRGEAATTAILTWLHLQAIALFVVFAQMQLAAADGDHGDDTDDGGYHFFMFLGSLIGGAFMMGLWIGTKLGKRCARVKQQASQTVVTLGSAFAASSTWLEDDHSSAARSTSTAAALPTGPGPTVMAEVLFCTKTNDVLHMRGCHHLRSTTVEHKVCKDCLRRASR